MRPILIELLFPIVDDVVVSFEHRDQIFVLFLIAFLSDCLMDDLAELLEIFYSRIERFDVAFFGVAKAFSASSSALAKSLPP
jgi:hypothetical protein